jgi:uncharacterized SAM-binding protein YcdF (DUF218 family)
MSPVFKRRLRRLIVATVLGVVLFVLAWIFAPAILVVDDGAVRAEGEVVLGGEPWTRPKRAAEVFKEAASLVVIVSGNGDCDSVRRQMEADGVPANMITTECDSRTTWENAQFSVKLLREKKATNVVIVTSWFHSRRSLACFEKVAPELHFSARPTACPPLSLRHPDAYTIKRVFQEYAKIAYYWVMYGVTPWL